MTVATAFDLDSLNEQFETATLRTRSCMVGVPNTPEDDRSLFF